MPRKVQKFIPIVPYLESCFLCAKEDGSYSPIILEPHQKRILEAAFTPDSEGRMPYRTVLYSTCKKGGKSTCEAGIASWFTFSGISPQGGEIYIIANDKSQAEHIVYKMLMRSIEASDILSAQCKDVLLSGIETTDGVTVRALANDYAGEAGANPVLSCWDELWGLRDRNGQRMWDEFTPVPTRRISMRLVVTYAGFEGEGILWNLYQSAMQGRRLWDDLPVWVNDEQRLFCFWDSGKEARRMPWQKSESAKEYYKEQHKSLSRSAWLRFHENRWATTEEGLNALDWDACVELGKTLKYEMPMEDKRLTLAVGIDAAWKFDFTSVMTAFKRQGYFYRGPGEHWPTGEGFSLEVIETYLLELRKHFRIGPVYYDPTQLVLLASRLKKKGFRMVEFPQSLKNHHTQGDMLTGALRYRRLVLHGSDGKGGSSGLYEQAMATSVKQTGRGIKLGKDDKNQKIDSITALAMALVGAETLPDYEDVRDQIMVIGRNEG